jgi:hypothetical protein
MGRRHVWDRRRQQYESQPRLHEPHPLRGLILVATAILAVALLFVWSAGEVAGGLWHGAWPTVPLVDSVGELVQLCQHPADPVAPGIPGGPAYFAVLTLLVLLVGSLAFRVFRLLHRRQTYWVPPGILSRSSYQPFLRVYRHGRGRRW